MKPLPIHFQPLSYLRVVVENVDTNNIYVRAGKDAGVLSLEGASGEACSHLLPLVRKGTQLNLLCPSKGDNGMWNAELAVLEPDYLVDVTTVAACFDTCSPKQQIITKLTPSDGAKAPILLGNFASQLLDESIHHPEAPPPYAESVRKFFNQNALDFAACSDPLTDFHRQACIQRDNIRALISGTKRQLPTFKPEQALLEPTIFAETLGLQGRMDLLQQNLCVLMEQKSGKRDFSGEPRLTHTIQLQLYIAILHYAAGIKDEDLSAFLLYSKYADGMMPQSLNRPLLREAMAMRNRLVAQEIAMATSAASVEDFFCTTKADDLRCNPSHTDKFWNEWKRPPVQHVLQALQSADELARAYFLRMFRFVSLEQMLAHIADDSPQPTGMASLWKIPYEERRDQGDLLWPLEIPIADYTAEATTCTPRLCPCASDVMTNSNFRTGDAVVLYAVPRDAEPDVRRTVAFRGALESISTHEIILQLSSPQAQDAAFPTGVTYAIEHDHVDTSRPLFRSLLALLHAPRHRRELVLSIRTPQYDANQRARGNYGEFQSMVDGACRSRDLYLIVGPPGTGKTSFGMLKILKETLLNPEASVLLTAYTNRAVDEICEKLLEACIPFLRIGRPAACSPTSRHALLSVIAPHLPGIEALKAEIRQARVVVATTTTLANNPQLFALRHFALCIVDEASQILEPQIMPLLTAHHQGRPAIQRFVLIGDHKQLPAVVTQSTTQSHVSEACLRSIGLTDCRHSFFQRMLQRIRDNRPECVYEMTRQGRMHPEVADFANVTFYGGHLQPAGLPHQTASLPKPADGKPTLQNVIHARRFLFIDAPRPTGCTPKTNTTEARIIAQLTVQLWRIFRSHHRTFSAARSLGIIVPYRGQIMQIRHQIQEEIHRSLPAQDQQAAATHLLSISIDTVERYQGSQRDIIIYGFTASTSKQLEFLSAESFTETDSETGRPCIIDRKLNVALTRAREQMFVVGNAELIAQNEMFNKLVTYAKRKHALLPAHEYLSVYP